MVALLGSRSSPLCACVEVCVTSCFPAKITAILDGTLFSMCIHLKIQGNLSKQNVGRAPAR